MPRNFNHKNLIKMKIVSIIFLAFFLVLSSCVPQKQHLELEEELKIKNQELALTKTQLSDCTTELKRLISDLSYAQDEIGKLSKEKSDAFEYVKDLTVLSKTASENIRETLAQLSKKDEYIRHIQAAMSKKDSINLVLAVNLKSVLNEGINDEDIQIDIEKTVVYITIADKLLFKSGSSRVSSKAKDILGKVAKVVNAQSDLEVMVEGYTDNKPISTSLNKDNWDLSVRRATAVVRVLQKDLNVEPQRLIAAGRSEYLPLESNETVEGRSRNRRTRIVLMPKLEQFFNLLEYQPK